MGDYPGVLPIAHLAAGPITPEVRALRPGAPVFAMTDDGRLFLGIYRGYRPCEDEHHMDVVVETWRGTDAFSVN